ncbi:hypothetical protein [Shewanella sp. Iso12]|uniref:hypothetical protein n=1 Tax=Shewanella sp. Iso12 TaxID=1826753 RepID=UPI00143059C9|nr:hypothetical protein [Shewanella sp. Iso12]NJI83077.1 hypothetical protein [Shewanella sp. Iso12]
MKSYCNILLPITLVVSTFTYAQHVVLNEDNDEKVCASVYKNLLSDKEANFHSAIKASGGDYDFTKWNKVKGHYNLTNNFLKYSKFDIDNNGTPEVVLEGLIGCSGDKSYYRVIEDNEINSDGSLNITKQDIWSKEGIGWCHNSTYRHYGIQAAFHLNSFKLNSTTYLTLESWVFGQKEHLSESFIIAKYTGEMIVTPEAKQFESPNDKLQLVCKFSYAENP